MAAARGGAAARTARRCTPRPASRSPSAPSSRCRNRRRTWSIPTPSSPPTAPTPRAGSCCRTRRPSATSNGPPRGVEGAHRFLQRVWRLVREAAAKGAKPGAPKPAQFGAGGRGAPPRGASQRGGGDGRHREAPLQCGGRAYLRARQRALGRLAECRATTGRRHGLCAAGGGGALGPNRRPHGAASGGGVPGRNSAMTAWSPKRLGRSQKRPFCWRKLSQLPSR